MSARTAHAREVYEAHVRSLPRDAQLDTPDAVQIASALHVGADAFLTNDRALPKATELRVNPLSDLIDR